MSLQKYAALLKTVELGSISLAAEQMGYTQSAVSRMILDLEKEWGVELLYRSRAGVTASSEGLRLLPLVRSIVAGLPHPEAVLTDTARFTQDLFRACAPHPQLAVLFSGSRRGLLIARFSAELKRLIFDLYPERKGDPAFEVSLSFRIYGSYYAFLENRQYGEEKVVEILGRLSSGQPL